MNERVEWCVCVCVFFLEISWKSSGFIIAHAQINSDINVAKARQHRVCILSPDKKVYDGQV